MTWKTKNKTRTCPICKDEFEVKQRNNHQKTCSSECSREYTKIMNNLRTQALYKRKKFKKISPEAKEFLNKFNFNRTGFKIIQRYSQSIETVLACFQEYLQKDEMSRMKIKEI